MCLGQSGAPCSAFEPQTRLFGAADTQAFLCSRRGLQDERQMKDEVKNDTKETATICHYFPKLAYCMALTIRWPLSTL